MRKIYEPATQRCCCCSRVGRGNICGQDGAGPVCACACLCVCVRSEGEGMDGAKVDNVVVACLPCALRNCAGFWADEAAREEGCWELVASHEREGDGEGDTACGLGSVKFLKRIKVEKSHWVRGWDKGTKVGSLGYFFCIPFGLGVKRVKSA